MTKFFDKSRTRSIQIAKYIIEIYWFMNNGNTRRYATYIRS